MAFPDFLIIGAPKAGSTALHVALAQHPDLFLSDPKEPKFFLCDQQPPDGDLRGFFCEEIIAAKLPTARCTVCHLMHHSTFPIQHCR